MFLKKSLTSQRVRCQQISGAAVINGRRSFNDVSFDWGIFPRFLNVNPWRPGLRRQWEETWMRLRDSGWTPGSRTAAQARWALWTFHRILVKSDGNPFSPDSSGASGRNQSAQTDQGGAWLFSWLLSSHFAYLQSAPLHCQDGCCSRRERKDSNANNVPRNILLVSFCTHDILERDPPLLLS